MIQNNDDQDETFYLGLPAAGVVAFSLSAVGLFCMAAAVVTLICFR